jgi:hypothetical protein
MQCWEVAQSYIQCQAEVKETRGHTEIKHIQDSLYCTTVSYMSGREHSKLKIKVYWS